jgi:hypothetical protein
MKISNWFVGLAEYSAISVQGAKQSKLGFDKNVIYWVFPDDRGVVRPNMFKTSCSLDPK